MKYNFDVDIDLANRDAMISLLDCVPASLRKDDKLVKHNSGVYLQNVPCLPLDYIASLDYKEAEKDGWFKIDLLNNSVYRKIKNEEHLNSLMSHEPVWEMLESKEIVEKFSHINNHFSIVNRHKPKSVEQLAMVLSIIRPAKRYLLGKSWKNIEKEIWQKPKNEAYFFKKSHAIAYALVIVTQMNLLRENILSEDF